MARSYRDRVAPRIQPSQRNQIIQTASQLGALSAKYESGGRGVGFISSGQGDPGGASYGIHQLSGRGSMPAFLNSPEGKPYREQFRGTQPMTGQFNRVYQTIAQNDPKGFAAAQQAFYTRTHYEPVRQVAERSGFDISNPGVRESLYSMSIQHGRARDLVTRAASRIQPNDGPANQVRHLYQVRSAYVAELGTLNERTRMAVLNRYQNEYRDALALVGQPQARTETTAVAPAQQTAPQGPDVSDPSFMAGANETPNVGPVPLERRQAPQMGVVDPMNPSAPIQPMDTQTQPQPPLGPRPQLDSGSMGRGGSGANAGWPNWAQQAHYPDQSPISPVDMMVPPAPPTTMDRYGVTSPMGWNERQPVMKGLLASMFGGGGFGAGGGGGFFSGGGGF